MRVLLSGTWMPDQRSRRSFGENHAEIGVRNILARGMNHHPMTLSGFLQGLIGSLKREGRMIALCAEVEQHEVLDGIATRSCEDFADEFRPLVVGQVATLAENPRDQVGGSARRALHGDVVVEFDS